MTFRRKKAKDINLKRINRQALLFNNREMRAIDRYCKKFRIKNKSRFMRETIMTTVLKDYPSLFFEDEPNLFYRPSRS